MRYDLDTEEGQFKAGKYFGIAYYDCKRRGKAIDLQTRALIHRLYENRKGQMCCRGRNIERKLLKAWQNGIWEVRNDKSSN
jgi:hypothetical protein